MSVINSIDYTKEILEYRILKKKSSINQEEICSHIISKLGIKDLNVNLKLEIEQKLQKYTNLLQLEEKLNDTKNNNLTINYKILISKVIIENLENLKVIDVYCNSCELYIYNLNNINYLLNSKKKIVSILKEWIDEDDEVPNEFKTSDNKVLDPIKRLPILEITIDKKASMYTNLKEGIYREYEYDELLESFRTTNQIIVC